MAGKNDKPDGMASFFGDDDLDWLDEEEDSAPPVVEAAPVLEAVPVQSFPEMVLDSDDIESLVDEPEQLTELDIERLVPDLTSQPKRRDRKRRKKATGWTPPVAKPVILEPIPVVAEETGDLKTVLALDDDATVLGLPDQAGKPIGILGISEPPVPIPLEPIAELSLDIDGPLTLDQAELFPVLSDTDDDVLLESALVVEDSAPSASPLWRPDAQSASWEDSLKLIVDEADGRFGLVKGELLAEAGQIALHRLADPQRAKVYYRSAESAGFTSSEMLRDLSQIMSAEGQWEASYRVLARRVTLLDGTASAEAALDAAEVAQNRLGVGADALEQLRHAVRVDGEHFQAKVAYSEQLGELEMFTERAGVLAQLARENTGPVGAEFWWRQGQALSTMSDQEGAIEAFAKARNAEPSLGAVFAMLSALYAQEGDLLARALLIEEEATRPGQVSPGWWFLQAATQYRELGNDDKATECYRAAIDAGEQMARREYQGWLVRQEHVRALVSDLEHEITSDSADSAGRVFAFYRLGRLKEEKEHDLTGALKAYRSAVALDSSAEPAAEAVARILGRLGEDAALITFWEDRVVHSVNEKAKIALLYRIVEQAESMGDNASVISAAHRIVLIRPDYIPGLEALQRAYRREESWESLAETHVQRALCCKTNMGKANHYYCAGAIFHDQLGEQERARELFGLALSVLPDYPAALDAMLDVLEALGDWSALAVTLRNAAEASEEVEDEASLLYRAARVFTEKTGDYDSAINCLRTCLMVCSGYEPAIGLLRDLSSRGGATEEVYRLYLREAEEASGSVRHWRLLAAADVAWSLDGYGGDTDLVKILEEEPTHRGAVQSVAVRLISQRSRAGLVEVHRKIMSALPAEEQLELRAWNAQVLDQVGDLVGVEKELKKAALVNCSGHHAVLAQFAEERRNWPLVEQLLQCATDPESRSKRAQVLGRRLGRVDEALEIYGKLLDEPALQQKAAIAITRLARGQHTELLIRAHRVLFEGRGSVGFRAEHGFALGVLLEHSERWLEAAKVYELVLNGRPESERAFSRAASCLEKVSDSMGLSALFERCRPASRRQWADALVRANDQDAALVQLRAIAGGSQPSLGDLLAYEKVAESVEDWRGVYQSLEKQHELLGTEVHRSRVLQKQKWILGEKLGDSDEAWELYNGLHRDNPTDRGVKETLARIAAARGDLDFGVQMLRELLATAHSAPQRALYERRIAELYEQAGQNEKARVAFLNALDNVSDDLDALAGLRRIAEAGGQWEATLQVLKRELGVAEGDRHRELLLEIASLTEANSSKVAVVQEAWRAVVETGTEDPVALRHLLALAESEEDWTEFVEFGRRLASVVTGEEVSQTYRRVGVVSQDKLGRDDAVHYYEKAISGDSPDMEACARLEGLFRQFGDYAGTVRCVELSFELSDNPADKVSALERGAQVELSGRHDRSAAAAFYQRLVAIQPDHRAALVFLADFFVQAERDTEALPVFQAVEPQMAENSDLDDFDLCLEVSEYFFNYAQLLIRLGHPHSEAVSRFERALELNPTHLPTLEQVGPLYMASAQWEKASRIYRQSIRLIGGHGDKKKVADTYVALGLTEYHLGQLDKAAKRFNKALDIASDHIGALRGMAGVLEVRSEWNAVINFYNNIIQYGKQTDDVIFGCVAKGQILDEQMHRPDKAAQHYERALTYNGRQPIVILRLAEIALRQSDWKKAGEYAHRGLQLTQQLAEVRAELLLVWSVVRYQQGDRRGAQGALLEAFAAQPSLKDTVGAEPLENPLALMEGIRKRLPSC